MPRPRTRSVNLSFPVPVALCTAKPSTTNPPRRRKVALDAVESDGLVSADAFDVRPACLMTLTQSGNLSSACEFPGLHTNQLGKRAEEYLILKELLGVD